MAVAIADLEEYRHRRETKREQDLRLELTSIADHIDEMSERVAPHMQRLWLVCREIGPAAMQSWNAVTYEHQRLLVLTGPEEAA